MRYTPALAVILALLVPGVVAPSAGTGSRTYSVTTKSFALHGFQVRWVRVDVPPPPIHGYVTYMYARLVDAHNRPVPLQRTMLHHILFQNYGHRGHRVGTVCPASDAQPFYGSGEEQQALRLPAGYGYPVEHGDRWSMRAMLMSHQPASTRVRIQYRLTVSTDRRLKPVVPFWIRTTGCKGPSYEVRGAGGPGAVQTDANDWTLPITGRIVAANGHLHGGARDMWLSQPSCLDRRLLGSEPWYGLDSHPSNTIYPLLHEPGPINTKHFLSAAGVPVRKGEQLRINATYDNERPHPQVMSVMHVYIAPGAADEPACAPLPSDAREARLRADSARVLPFAVPGRARSRARFVGLYSSGPAGRPVPISRPAGPVEILPSGATSTIDGQHFEHPNIRVPLGARLTWRFRDTDFHNVVLANGPWSAGAPRNRYRSPDSYTTTFPRPGTYQLFCQLHPLTMHQQVQVSDTR